MLSIELKAGLELREDLVEAKGINISERFVIKVFQNSAEFILTDEEGKRIFGGNVDVTAYESFKTNQREVKISKGSMGPFDMSCEASVESTLLMAELIQNFEEFAESCEYIMDRVANQQIK
jgi:hypothetical protein